jgi:hypothetical protein
MEGRTLNYKKYEVKYKNEIRVVSLPKGGRQTTSPKYIKNDGQRKDNKKTTQRGTLTDSTHTKQACNKQHTTNVCFVAHHTLGTLFCR